MSSCSHLILAYFKYCEAQLDTSWNQQRKYLAQGEKRCNGINVEANVIVLLLARVLSQLHPELANYLSSIV